jgi:tripartite-type tricarboxylate transporter receptor subunit TctC
MNQLGLIQQLWKSAQRRLDRRAGHSVAMHHRGFKASAIMVFCIAVGASLSTHVQAQTFPNRPIRIVVPAAAGGALDIVARIMAEKASQTFKQGVYVENRSGANWIIGMDLVAKSDPDGYTLLLVSTSGFSINPHLFKNVPPVTDFVPITNPTKGTFVLLTNPKLGVANVKEFVALLKANPGKYNHASNSATTKLLSELFKAQAGLKYADISYRGAALAINDTASGVTDFCFVDYGSASGVLQDGMLRPLATTSDERYPLSPDIPSMGEDVANFSVDGGTILLAPSKVDPQVLSTLQTVFIAALKSPDVVSRFGSIGQVPVGSTPKQTADALSIEVDKWANLIKEKNIKIE